MASNFVSFRSSVSVIVNRFPGRSSVMETNFTLRFVGIRSLLPRIGLWRHETLRVDHAWSRAYLRAGADRGPGARGPTCVRIVKKLLPCVFKRQACVLMKNVSSISLVIGLACGDAVSFAFRGDFRPFPAQEYHWARVWCSVWPRLNHLIIQAKFHV